MKLKLERRTATDLPFTLLVDQLDDTVMAGSTLRIPVHYSDVTGSYNVELAGFRVEAEDAALLPSQAQPLLEALINMARLPSYVFVARRSGGIYPVYTVGDEVFATTPGGPVFRHVELAKVRDYLSDYLHLTGVLGTPGRSDKLHVRGVDPQTLELVRPIFYLKKRVVGQVDFWAPVFQTESTIYTYAASARREVPINAGHDILALHRMVADALIADRRLRTAFDLRPDRLFATAWDALKTHCTLDPQRLNIGGVDIAVYRYKDTVIGLEERTETDQPRPSLYLDRTVADLAERITADFARRGLFNAAVAA